jgi:two-component system sensor histidine kinase UhpB
LQLHHGFGLLSAEIARRSETEKIARQVAESSRFLSARILELRDVERRKIARELHDRVGQYPTGLKLSFGQFQAAKSLECGTGLAELGGIPRCAIRRK